MFTDLEGDRCTTQDVAGIGKHQPDIVMNFVPLIIAIPYKQAHGLIYVLTGVERVPEFGSFMLLPVIMFFIVVLGILFLDVRAIEQHNGSEASGGVGGMDGTFETIFNQLG